MAILDYIEERPKVSEKWSEIKDYMATHIFGKPPERIFRERRPLESENTYALDYRLNNYQPITKQPMKLAIDAIVEAAGHIHVEEIGIDDSTSEFLKDYKINVAGKDFTVNEFVVNFISRYREYDANATVVVMPVHPSEVVVPEVGFELPNFNNIRNERIGLDIKQVRSDDIHYIDSEVLMYKAGEWLYKTVKKQDFYEPYFYILDKFTTRILFPVKTEKGFRYEVEVLYNNNLSRPPFQVIGSNPVIEEVDGEMKEYHDPTYSGAVAILNEVVGVKSDSQIVDTRFTYPEKITQYQACGASGTYVRDPKDPLFGQHVVYDDDNTCSVCSVCSGSGQVAPDTSPFGSHIMVKGDMFDESGKFIPPIQFITPPLESPEYLDKKWRLDLSEGKRALFITDQNMTNQSGESKGYDVRQKVTTITGAVKAIYSIKEQLLNTIQEFFKGEPDIVLILPVDFNIKTSQDITLELSQAKETTSTYTSELTRELLLKKFGNSEANRKIVDFLELNDKFFGFEMDDIIKSKAIYGSDFSARDKIVHDKGMPVLKKMAKDEGFLRLSDDKLLEEFNKAIDKLIGVEPEEAALIDDPLLLQEAEAKAKLKGTVGGVQGIIQINQAVADGTMSEASAEELLVAIYGFEDALAKRLIEPTNKGVIGGILEADNVGPSLV